MFCVFVLFWLEFLPTGDGRASAHNSTLVKRTILEEELWRGKMEKKYVRSRKYHSWVFHVLMGIDSLTLTLLVL